MKVLQINAVYKVSSTGRTVFELHQFLQKKGIESYVACANGNRSEGIYLIGSKFGKKLHALLSRLSGLQGYFSTFSTIKLIRFIQQIRPDIVHLRNLHANYVNMPVLLGYLAHHDIGTVITLHDCWFYTGKCTHYTMAHCWKWQEGCGDCPQLGADNKSWFFDRTSKIWKDKKMWLEKIPRLAVIGVSDWITNEAKKSLLGKARIIKRIYNWIDLETFRYIDSEKLQEKWELKDKFVILGIASQWSDKKGLNIFAELGEIIENDTRIVLVGNMPECILPESIIQVPAVNDVRKLVGYYCMADVFLQLSQEESFGKVVAEALACGTPVITVDSTANGELVPEACGAVLETLESTCIMDALYEIKKRGKAHYKDSCRKFAVSSFSLAERSEDYVDIYQQLMKIKKERFLC